MGSTVPPSEETAISAQLQQFLDEWYYRSVYSSLGRAWTRQQAATLLVDILRLLGFEFSQAESEKLVQLEDDAAFIDLVIANMPATMREQFEGVALQLQTVLHEVLSGSMNGVAATLSSIADEAKKPKASGGGMFDDDDDDAKARKPEKASKPPSKPAGGLSGDNGGDEEAEYFEASLQDESLQRQLADAEEVGIAKMAIAAAKASRERQLAKAEVELERLLPAQADVASLKQEIEKLRGAQEAAAWNDAQLTLQSSCRAFADAQVCLWREIKDASGTARRALCDLITLTTVLEVGFTSREKFDNEVEYYGKPELFHHSFWKLSQGVSGAFQSRAAEKKACPRTRRGMRGAKETAKAEVSLPETAETEEDQEYTVDNSELQATTEGVRCSCQQQGLKGFRRE